MCSQTGCYDKCETINAFTTISVSAYLMGENQAHTVLLCHSCISAMFQANKTDFW